MLALVDPNSIPVLYCTCTAQKEIWITQWKICKYYIARLEIRTLLVMGMEFVRCQEYNLVSLGLCKKIYHGENHVKSATALFNLGGAHYALEDLEMKFV